MKKLNLAEIKDVLIGIIESFGADKRKFTDRQEDALNDAELLLKELLEYSHSFVSPSDAIEFAEWIRTNNWLPSAGSSCGMADSWFKIIDVKCLYKTTTELYPLFTEERKQK